MPADYPTSAGSQGPEGPQGPAGPEGPQGPAGADGADAEYTNIMGAVVYAGSVAAARPTEGFAAVHWINFPTEPDNWLPGDLWDQP